MTIKWSAEMKKLNIALFIQAGIVSSVLLSPVAAQTTTSMLPSCSSADSDSDGDGFGYENGQSCLVVGGQAQQAQVGQCIDSDGDGFGWNGVATCEPDSPQTAGQCVDTDGDGFGWNGVATCDPLMNSSQTAVTLANCLSADSDSDGDGFGFENGQSCIVVAGQPSENQEIDLFRCDDVGSFPWGWNPTTNTTCRLDLVNSPAVVSGSTVNVVPATDFIGEPLTCKIVVEEFFCNCDGSTTDRLEDAQNISDVFYTATLLELNQIESFHDSTFQTMTIDGTWDDKPGNELPLFRNLSSIGPSLRYVPTTQSNIRFFGSLTYTQDESGNIFMNTFRSFGGGDDITTVAHCVVI